MYELEKVKEWRQTSHKYGVTMHFIDPEPFTLGEATYRPISVSITYAWTEGERIYPWNANGAATLRAVRIKKDGTEGQERRWESYSMPIKMSDLVKRLAKQHRPADMPDPEEKQS